MPNYRPILETLRTDLERFIAERDAIEEKIERIGTAIQAIEVLAQEFDAPILEPPPLPPDEEQGFTDRVREILKTNSPKRLTAIEIRDVLMKATPDDDPKIVLIHTHNTLKRLRKQEEVKETQIADGRNAYEWKFVANSLWERLRTVGELASSPIDPEKLPESVRGVIYPKADTPKPPTEARSRLADAMRKIKDQK